LLASASVFRPVVAGGSCPARSHVDSARAPRRFKDYLRETYTPEQMRERFGTDDAESLSLSTTGDKILWAAPQPEYLKSIHEPGPEQTEPVPVDNVQVALPLPDGMTPESVVMTEPWKQESESLPFEVRAGRVCFTVPHLDIYRVIRVS